jgi:hypothetical protein
VPKFTTAAADTVPTAPLRVLGGHGQFLVQGLGGLVPGLRAGDAVLHGQVEEHGRVCHVCSLVAGSEVSVLNAYAVVCGDRLPGAQTARAGLPLPRGAPAR